MKPRTFAIIPVILALALSVLVRADPSRAQSGAQPCSERELSDLRERYALVERDLEALHQQDDSLLSSLLAFDALSDGTPGPIVFAKSWTLAPPVSRQLRLVVDHLVSTLSAMSTQQRVVLVDQTGRITSPLAILAFSDALGISGSLLGPRLSPKQLSAVLADLVSRSARAKRAVSRKHGEFVVRIDQKGRDLQSLGSRLDDCRKNAPCVDPPRRGLSSGKVDLSDLALPSLRFQAIQECPAPSTPVATTSPLPVTTVAPPTTLSCAAAATWVHQTTGIGSTTWTITSDGTAEESGLGNAKGKATLSGQTLTITFVASDKVTAGSYTWKLTTDCRSGTGELKFTGPPSRFDETHTSTVTRSGS